MKENRRDEETELARKQQLEHRPWEVSTKRGLPQEARGGKETDSELPSWVQGHEHCAGDPAGISLG